MSETGVLSSEEVANVHATSNFVPSGLETRLGSHAKIRSSRDQEHRSDMMERLGESPARRTLHLRCRLSSVKQIKTPRTFRAGTTVTGAERCPGRDSLISSKQFPSPSHKNKQDLLKLNLCKASFAVTLYESQMLAN